MEDAGLALRSYVASGSLPTAHLPEGVSENLSQSPYSAAQLLGGLHPAQRSVLCFPSVCSVLSSTCTVRATPRFATSLPSPFTLALSPLSLPASEAPGSVLLTDLWLPSTSFFHPFTPAPLRIVRLQVHPVAP